MINAGRIGLATITGFLLIPTVVACSGSSSPTSPGASSDASPSIKAAASRSCAHQAQQAVDKERGAPTLPVPPALDMQKMAGKSIWLIQPSPVQIEHEIGDAFIAAAKSVHMHAQVFYSQGTAQSDAQGLSQAIAQHPAGIVVNVNPSLVSQQISDARSKKIAIIDMFQESPTEALPAGVQAHLAVDWNARGRAMADWALADGSCKQNIATLNVPAYPSANEQVAGLQVETQLLCAGCKVYSTMIDLSQLATSVPSVTQSLLRSHSDATYFDALFDSLVTFSEPAAHSIHSAINVIGGDGIAANITLVRGGKQALDVALAPSEWVGYAAVDQISRAYLGEQAWDVTVPIRLIDKTNVGTASTEQFPGFADTKTKFLAAWGLG